MSIWAWFDSGEGREAAIPLAVIFLGFAVALLTWGFRAVEFYERGAVERAVWRRRVFLYDDVAKLDFELVNVYVGVKSEFTRAAKMYRMRLIMTDGRALGLVENYEQELDAVRDQIQAAVNRKNKYYVIAGRREKGPYTVIQLREALENKTVTRSTLVRAEGGDEQIRLGELLR